MRIHQAGHTTLEENTRWVLHVQVPGVGSRQVLCVYNPRNLVERWTTRYGWRLPSHGDHAMYPFCPRDEWWKASREAFGTVSSKPAWIDKHGNGWARPNIPNGAGYHWDVLIRNVPHQNAISVDQINVVQYGAPLSEGVCGSLHHVATALAGKVCDQGWTC